MRGSLLAARIAGRHPPSFRSRSPAGLDVSPRLGGRRWLDTGTRAERAKVPSCRRLLCIRGSARLARIEVTFLADRETCSYYKCSQFQLTICFKTTAFPIHSKIFCHLQAFQYLSFSNFPEMGRKIYKNIIRVPKTHQQPVISVWKHQNGSTVNQKTLDWGILDNLDVICGLPKFRSV